MYLIKLGGSVITDKATPSTFKPTVMDALATHLAKVSTPFIGIHGAGSFGHVLAKQYQLNKGYTKEDQLLGLAQTHASVQALNTIVLNHLHHHGIPAVSLPPHAFLTLDNHQPTRSTFTLFEQYLQHQFIPITFGDVVLDSTLTFSICSGDLLIELLAKHFKPDGVIFVMDEDGIYTANPKTDTQAQLVKTSTAQQLTSLTTSANTHADVTSGMKGKINTIQRLALLGIDTFVVNGNHPDRLKAILTGKSTICTHVRGNKP